MGIQLAGEVNGNRNHVQRGTPAVQLTSLMKCDTRRITLGMQKQTEECD